MLPSNLLLLALAATPTLAQDPPSPLLPWEITRLSTFSPSGRPGSSPYSSLFVGVTDPNPIPIASPATYPAISPLSPISANCSVRWNAYTEQPFGWVTPCADVNPGSGRWTVEMLKGNATAEGPSATRDFRVRIVLERSVILYPSGGILSFVFEGEGAFSLGKELSMVCGASGVCSLGLKEGTAPVLVRQMLRERKCVFGVCE